MEMIKITKKTKSANEILQQEYGNSKNFITPYIEKKGKINKNVAYELASGRDDNNNQLYGICLVSYNPKKETTRRLYDKSKLFFSRNEAINYINSLKHKFKTITKNPKSNLPKFTPPTTKKKKQNQIYPNLLPQLTQIYPLTK